MKSGLNSPWSAAGIIRLFLVLAIGIGLGAYVHSRLSGRSGWPAQSVEPADVEPSVSPGAAPNEVHIQEEAQREVGISVEPAGMRDLQDMLQATGTVSEDPTLVAHIRPLARGLIEQAFVRLGDRVSKGDPLVEYDNIELGFAIGEYLGAKAELQRSLTDLAVKKTILERGKEMLRVGAIARTSYDLREAEFNDAVSRSDGARASMEKIGEQIHRFGWTDQDLANLLAKNKSGRTIAHSILKAPFAGIITAFHASVGEVVEPSTELLTITDMSTLWVLADVFEKDLSHVKSGQAVQVRVASYPGKTFSGKITYVADAIEPKTRTAKVRCVVNNASGLLKLEMFAAVEIPVDRVSAVLAVPDSAIQQIEGKPVVFVRTTETEFQKREILLGIESGGYTEIRSGLSRGELVASRGSYVIKTEFLRNLIGEEE